jgi:hypothetical protein
MESDLKSKEILNNLKSSDSEFLIDTIDKIRESGNRMIMEGLFDLLHTTADAEVKGSIIALLSELKHQESAILLLEAIKNEKYLNERKDLVCCCWQNGLSYIDHLPLFVDLIIDESFQIAFEAFTVIEHMYGKTEDQVIDQECKKIEAAYQNANKEKAYLFNELLTILKDIPEKSQFRND